MRHYKTIMVAILLLGSLQGVQAATFPTTAIFDIGPNPLVNPGNYTQVGDLPDSLSDPNAAWFRFTLDASAHVALDTFGSLSEFGTETILALYDPAGTLLGQNYQCGGIADNDSCLELNLVSGTYLAGVTDFFLTPIGGIFETAPFVDGWMFGDDVDNDDSTVRLNIAVSAVPVPAAVWLFGSALIGFVGMARRTSIKS